MSLRSFPKASMALRGPRTPLTCLSSRTRCLAQTQCLAQARYLSQTQRRCEEGEGKKDKPPPMSTFHQQLFRSMGQRIATEKAELADLAKYERVRWHETAFSVIALCVATGAIAYYFGKNMPRKPPTTSTTSLMECDPPEHDIREMTLEPVFMELQDIVGRGNVTVQKSELESHAGSSWSTHPTGPNDLPFCVVKPRSTEEVSAIVKICHARKIPMTAYSGGTSLEGHFAATRGGVCIDFTNMDKILALHTEDLDVVVQPGVGWELLNEELGKLNLFFPPDPGPGAMIGGMIGTGCSGTNAYRYGTMKDWVLSLTVVLADGTIIKTRQRPRKSSAGYDLTRMFVGSEGTLGIVTEATLKVTPKPQNTSVAVCAFKSVRQAADTVFNVVGAGIPIAAIEILDDVQMACINDAGMTSKTWKVAPTLFFKFAGTPQSVKEQISQVQKLASKNGSVSFEFARNEQEQVDLWQARKEALWSVMAKAGEKAGEKGGDAADMAVWTTDVAVPISKLADIIDITKEDIRKSGLLGSIVGHVGDGNFHAIILYNRATEYETTKHLVHRMVKRAIEMEGTATGEHGVGLVKRDYLPHELGESTVDAMRRLKLAFDPMCLLNCDKIVRVQRPKQGEIEEW